MSLITKALRAGFAVSSLSFVISAYATAHVTTLIQPVSVSGTNAMVFTLTDQSGQYGNHQGCLSGYRIVFYNGSSGADYAGNYSIGAANGGQGIDGVVLSIGQGTQYGLDATSVYEDAGLAGVTANNVHSIAFQPDFSTTTNGVGNSCTYTTSGFFDIASGQSVNVDCSNGVSCVGTSTVSLTIGGV